MEGDKIGDRRSEAAFSVMRTRGVNELEGRLNADNLDT